MRPRAVTLDAGGTLITVAEPVGITYARFAAAHGIAVAVEDVERRFRDAFAAAPPLAFPDGPATTRTVRERAWWRAVVRDALGRPDADLAFDACFVALYAHYAEAHAWRVFPEVPGVLEALRSRGLRLGVVSNFDSRLPSLLAALGIAPLIDVILHSSACGYAKPNPGMLHLAAKALGVRTALLLHVGDAAEDVAAATAAGASVLRLERGPRSDGPPQRAGRLASLEELPGHPLLGAAQP